MRLSRPTRSALYRLRLMLLVVTMLSLFTVDLARKDLGLRLVNDHEQVDALQLIAKAHW